jgi:beta-glucosidase/6-phospho-beta-glucosidase/beta-galactosidase
VFENFFFAGYECATGYNANGVWIDQIAATEHDLHADDDYRALRKVGLCAAREAIRWPLVDQGRGRFNFSSVEPFLAASRKHRIEIIWDLFHFGYPPHADVFSPDFSKRFADYCYAAACYLCSSCSGTCYFTPVNEPSFFAWAGGEVGQFAPHAKNRGKELKVALARAAIQGINAIRIVDPGARIINVDPICHVVAPPNRPDLEEEARLFNSQWVFESWDMLAGRLLPELGGSPGHLDIVGMNYYWTNQWELGREREPLAEADWRLVPLRCLVRNVWERYRRDVMITETTHVNECRPGWLRYVTSEAEALLREGVPLRGVCLYPILGMPEWHSNEWTPMGLWDLVYDGSRLTREVCQPMLRELERSHRVLKTALTC